MSFKNLIVCAAKDFLGDDKFALLRHNSLARRGLEKYGKQFEETEGSPRNILMCCPTYGNLGDHAIALAERKMLNHEQHRPVLSFSGDTTALLSCLRRYVSPDDNFYLTGGGNMEHCIALRRSTGFVSFLQCGIIELFCFRKL